jgi:DNA polymerase III epsilon subunit family exonuclease
MDMRRDTLTKGERLLSNVVVFDLETTGLSPTDDEIIQIAAVRIERGVIQTMDRFISYVKPNRSIASFIISLTGITNERLKTAPGALSALKKFSAFCGDALLIAHNGHAFDIQFIRSACCNSMSNIREFRYFDSMHLSWLAWGRERYRSHSLDAVVSRLQINTEHSRRHDAQGDVTLLAQCVVRLVERLDRDGWQRQPTVYYCVLPWEETRGTEEPNHRLLYMDSAGANR